MSISYECCIRTGVNLSHIQISCDGVFLALPLTKTTIGIWTVEDLTAKPLELEGHRLTLTSLCLGNKDSPKLLCSSSRDHVIVWDVKHARNCLHKGNKPRGFIVGSGLGDVQYTSFSPDDGYIALCCEMDVIVVKSQSKATVATLKGHNNVVTCAEFCPHYHSTVVSISEDRTFKVWDISDATLIYQSHVLTASPLIAMSMDLHQPYVAMGTADGVVMVFDLTDGNNFRCLHKVDVDNKIRKRLLKAEEVAAQSPINGNGIEISSQSKQFRPTLDRGDNNVLDTVELGATIQGLYFSYLPSSQQKESPQLSFFKSSHIQELYDVSPVLLVGTSGALLQINAKNMEICEFYNLQDSVPVQHGIETSDKVIGAAGSVCFTQGCDPYTIHCFIGSQFQNQCHIVSWKHSGSVSNVRAFESEDLSKCLSNLQLNENMSSQLASTQQEDDGHVLNVLSNVPLLENTVLKAEMVPKVKETPKKKEDKKKSTSSANKPLTFHSKVKSSGYTEAPRRTMFQPKTDFSKTSTKGTKNLKTEKRINDSLRQYPTDCDPPSVLQSSVQVAERPTPINSIAISADGQNVATALASKVVVTYRVPWKESHIGTSYIGHNHSVNDVSWSYDGNFLISASDDKTAAVWKKDLAEPVMVMDTVKANVIVKDGQTKDKENVPFSKEMKYARFYYQDKFLLLANGNSLYLYKYHLDTDKCDIKRYLTKCRYKLVLQHETASQQITALSSPNGFYSYLVMYAGSNRAVDIFDMNSGKIVRTIQDVHTRPSHVIRQNLGSTYSSQPSEAYNLFVTGAASDCIKLWDTRQESCLRRYEGHMNRSYPCGLDISPCGRYICSGSENRAAYIFDIRGGTYCQKLTGHPDTVTDVAFHPLQSQLITSTLDGKMYHFSTS